MGKFRAIADGFRKAAPESISGITRDSLRADAQASWDALDGTIGNRDLYTRGNTPAVRGKWDTAKVEPITDEMVGGTPEARARLQEQGFDIPLYRGMKEPMAGEGFAPSDTGWFGGGVYGSRSPKIASDPRYTGAEGNVTPYLARGPLASRDEYDALVKQAMPTRGKYKAGESDKWAAQAVDELKRRGYTGVDGGGADSEVNVFHPKDTRSIFAKGDPAKRDSNDLLASALLAAGVGGGAYAAGGQGDADAAPLTPYGAPNAQFDQQLINKANAPQISAGPTDSEYLGNVVSPALEGLSQLWSRPIDAGQNFIRSGKSVSPYIRHLRNDPSAIGGDILEMLDQTGALGFGRDIVDQNRYGGAATDAFASMDLAGAMRDEALAQALLKKRKH